MSLDNIHLPPFLVQHLYKKSLVALEEEKNKVVAPANDSISFLGKNEKAILIIINEKETAFLADADLNLLVSILSACKLSLADVALVNFDKNKTCGYTKLMEEFSPAFILLFGIEPQALEFPLNFPNFQLQKYNNQTYLSSPTLKVLGSEKEHKKELWLCLQKHFFKN